MSLSIELQHYNVKVTGFINATVPLCSRLSQNWSCRKRFQYSYELNVKPLVIVGKLEDKKLKIYNDFIFPRQYIISQ